MKKSSSRLLTYLVITMLALITICATKINNTHILEELCAKDGFGVIFSPFSFSGNSADTSSSFLDIVFYPEEDSHSKNAVASAAEKDCFADDIAKLTSEESCSSYDKTIHKSEKSRPIYDIAMRAMKVPASANECRDVRTPIAHGVRDRRMSSRKGTSKIKYIGSEEEALTLGLGADHVGFYAISDSDDLFEFAEITVNDPQASAVLLCDVTVNKDLFEKKLTLDPLTLEPSVKSGIDVKAWTPIAEFGGVFDGGGHTISGIFIKSDSFYVGFFSEIISGGMVKDLEITSSCIYSSSESVGIVSGKNLGTVTSVKVSDSIVSSNSDFVGGIVGSNAGEICASNFCGKVNAKMYAGGITGDNFGSIRSSFVLSSDGDFVNAERYVGGIAGRSCGSVSCSYSLAKVGGGDEIHYVVGAQEYGSVLQNVFALSNGCEDTESGVEISDKKRFASGEICYLLNSDGECFYQTVGVGYPLHLGERVCRNHTYDCPGDTDGEVFYSNEDGDVIKNPDHLYIFDCDEKCEYCNFERKPPKMHTFVDKCDGLCDACGQTREAPHNYENSCDDTCNDCGSKRDASHKYNSDCDEKCNECGYIRQAVPHKFSYSCDEVCDECGAIRTRIVHTFTNDCDGECNYCDATRIPPHCFDGDCDTACNLCGYKRSGGTHTYDSDCDAECNICKEKRTPEHHFSSDCDEICDLCDYKRSSLSDHVYDGSCDSECNACGHHRTAADHSFISSCSAVCTECGYVRTPPSSHTFFGGCLARCSLCGAEPENASHTYDDDCDAECNICGEIRKTQGHTFGEWRTALSPTLTEFGINVRSCSVCGKTESETTAPLIYDAKYIAIFSLCGLAILALIVLIIKLIIDRVYSRQAYRRYYR